MSSLVFPSDLPVDYHFSLQFKTYSRPDPFTGTINLDEPSSEGSPGYGNIRLPIPSNIVDSQTLTWGKGNGTIAQAIEDSSKGFTSDEFKRDALAFAAGVGNEIGNLGTSYITGNMARTLTQLGISSVSPVLNAIFQNSGKALNPVLTQIFTAPEFKVHEFSWKLSPDRADESFQLQNIIDTVYTNALPGTIGNGLFFSYPSIAIVKIITGDNELYKFQPCVVTNFTVNYAGSGIPAFFANTKGAASVELKMTLLEIILNTRENHPNTAGVGKNFRNDYAIVGNAKNLDINDLIKAGFF